MGGMEKKEKGIRNSLVIKPIVVVGVCVCILPRIWKC